MHVAGCLFLPSLAWIQHHSQSCKCGSIVPISSSFASRISDGEIKLVSLPGHVCRWTLGWHWIWPCHYNHFKIFFQLLTLSHYIIYNLSSLSVVCKVRAILENLSGHNIQYITIWDVIIKILCNNNSFYRHFKVLQYEHHWYMIGHWWGMGDIYRAWWLRC